MAAMPAASPLDHDLKITLDRGLDLFQWFEFSPFNAAAVMQEGANGEGMRDQLYSHANT